MIESRIEFKVESILEGYEWLVSFREIDINNGSSEVYVVIINLEEINFKENKVNDIHIENQEYLYYISSGDEEIIDLGYEIFKAIENLVVEEIKLNLVVEEIKF